MHLKANKPYISVVVPIYNVEKYLRRCIESILNQDYTDFELILVNDGSTDSSKNICDEYETRYTNIKVIHKENGGLSSARLAGFKSAKGELICFIDSDDYIDQSYLSKMSEPFKDASIELSICGYATDNNNEISKHKLPYSSDIISNRDIAENYILPLISTINETSSINIPAFVHIRMYRRKLLSATDFLSERVYFTEDTLMNILYAKRLKGDIAIVNEPLDYYCINPGSLTLKYRENTFKMLMACNMKCRELTADLNVDAIHLKKRIDSNLIQAATYSIYNIGKIRNYKRFKRELRVIYNTPDIRRLFDYNIWPIKATWHKIIYYTHKYNLHFLLYQLLKTRKVL